MFKLSQRSLSRLEGVNDQLKLCVLHAIKVTKVDFGVIEGVRTVERQKELVESGACREMKSRHIDRLTVARMPYDRHRRSWELNLYDDIADAMKESALEHGVSLRWGAAWHIDDVRNWNGTMEDAMNAYIDLRRSQGRRPYIDAPHFELST